MSKNIKNESSAEIRNMLHDTWILFAITLIAGIILGFVYQITKEPIAIQEEKAKNEACKEVFADAETFEVVTEYSMEDATAHFAEAGFTGQSMSDGVRVAKRCRRQCLRVCT